MRRRTSSIIEHFDFDLKEYYNRIEAVYEEIWREQKASDESDVVVILWWGFEYITLYKNGDIKWGIKEKPKSKYYWEHDFNTQNINCIITQEDKIKTCIPTGTLDSFLRFYDTCRIENQSYYPQYLSTNRVYYGNFSSICAL